MTKRPDLPECKGIPVLEMKSYPAPHLGRPGFRGGSKPRRDLAVMMDEVLERLERDHAEIMDDPDLLKEIEKRILRRRKKLEVEKGGAGSGHFRHRGIPDHKVEKGGRRFVVKSEDERLVYGEVYVPLRVDTDGEAMTAAEIKKMAHAFLSKGRTGNIDVSHNLQQSGCTVVESWLARSPDTDGFIEGAWVIGAKVTEDLWPAVKSGELNGFSFHGKVNKRRTRAKVQVTKMLEGETEEATADGLPLHTHKLKLAFDSNGRIDETYTEEALGHRHLVSQATATKPEMEHSHRIILSY